MGRKILTFLTVVAVISLLVAPAAIAGGKAKSGGSSIWIEESITARSADGDMHHGDPVAFGFKTKHWDDVYNTGPWLRLECYVGGNLVYWENRAGFEGGYRYGEPFTLGPSLAWPSGEADCMGVLGHMHAKNGKFMTEATVDFHVVP
jgi:hypothetical protein